MKNLPIVLFLSRRYLPHVGGVEKHIENVSKLLLERYQVIVITERHDKNLPVCEKINEVEVWRIPLRGDQTTKSEIWWWILQHFSLFWNADVIHIHDVFFWMLPFWPLLFWKKMYMTFHGYEPPGPPNWKQIFWHRLAAHLTRGNICVGGFHQKWYGVKPDVVTFGGVNVGGDHLSKTSKENKILFVGRLEEDTGIWQYLEALKTLKSDEASVPHLDIFGDGLLRTKCTEFAQKNELDVTFHGFFPEVKYRNYPVVFASQYLSILEALANECTVIAFANAPMKKDYLMLTPFSKWIVITETPQEIAHTLLLKKELKNEAIQWARQQTWNTVTTHYVKLWTKNA